MANGITTRSVTAIFCSYRQTHSSMSANAAAMAASFSVTLRRARERNRDLPSAAFRWSAGYFYLYLARKGYLWGRYGRCLRDLNAALWANPLLLLKTAIYRIFLKSLWLVLISPTRKGCGKQVRPLPEGKGTGVALPLTIAKGSAHETENKAR